MLANFGVLIKMTVKKLKQNRAANLARKQKETKVRVEKRLRNRIKKWTTESLPDSHPRKPLTLIPEESYEDDGASLVSESSFDQLKDIDDIFGVDRGNMRNHSRVQR